MEHDYELVDQVTWDEEEYDSSLETFYMNGKFLKETTLTEIRERIKNNL